MESKQVHAVLIGCALLALSAFGNAQTCSTICPDGSKSPLFDCDADLTSDPCGGSGGGGNAGNSGYDPYAASRAQAAADAAAAAAAEQKRREEADRFERDRLAAEKRRKDAQFIRDRDAAAGTLKGSSGSSGSALGQLKGLSGAGSSGLKGSGFDSGTSLKGVPDPAGKPARAQPHTDTSVVDARNVPSGLPKAVDKAIATAYANAPPGVSDRVRKGFQAVAERDWKVAKAWFQDALKRDPGNEGIKRLIAATDSSRQATVVDLRNEPAGLGGSSTLKGSGTPTAPAQPAYAARGGTLLLPDPDDIKFLFPGLQAMEDKQALDYLFGLDAQPAPSKAKKSK